MTEPEPAGQDQARGHAEIAAAVAVLTATYQFASGSLPQQDYTAVVTSLAVDLFPEQPFNMVLPMSWIALRSAQLYARATGRTLPDVLTELGVEAATAPLSGQ